MLRPMRICFVVQRRHLEARLPKAVIDLLRSQGHDVDVWVPEDRRIRLSTLEVSHELYVARCRSATGLALLAGLDGRGANLLNRFRAIWFSSNKATTTATLRARQLPHPPTFLAERGEQLKGLPSGFYPMVVKPLVGEACEGVRLIRDRSELGGLGDGPVYAQRYIANSGQDHKAYVVGDEVRVIRKPSLLHGGGGPRVEEPADPVVERLARRCGRLFGLELYGVDLIWGEDGWEILEVNDFPSFDGLHDAPEWIADYVLSRASHTERVTAEVY